MSEVFQSVQVLPGVGPKRLEPLAELGIETVYDLLTHFPFRYEDIQIRDVQTIMDQEKVTLKGLVATQPVVSYYGFKKNRLAFRMAIEKQVIQVAFFNQPYLKDKIANRTELSTLTRLFSRRLKAMPVAVLFRYGNHIALANTERTQYKQTYREEEKIGKVSILKDIDILNPHRGHLDILETLKIPAKIKTFRDLYAHWQEVFNVSTLNKKFYNELFAWFQWTISEEVGVTYPNDTKTDQDDRVQLEEQVIRLITRVLFVWFIKQKHLVPNNLFEEAELGKILKDFQANSLENGNYYNAILQNLFFATLNKKSY